MDPYRHAGYALSWLRLRGEVERADIIEDEILRLRACVAELEAAIREHRRAVHQIQVGSLGLISPAPCDKVLWSHIAAEEE
jgi:hypothetical protein